MKRYNETKSVDDLLQRGTHALNNEKG